VRYLILALGLVALGFAVAPGTGTARTAYVTAGAAKKCHYATKKAHGKKKRVKVCIHVRATNTPVSKHTPTPTKPAIPPTPTGTATSSGSAIKTVFVIVEENHDWSSIYGRSSAPYINNVLLPQASYATQYYNAPGLHASEPNYLWLEAGTNCFSDTGCITDDNPPSSHATNSMAHLVTLLDNAGVSWRAYQENITDGTCPLTNNYLYAVKHNPFVFFKNVTSSTSYCTSHERSYSDLADDLAHNTVARYNFITPNLCDDGHDSCAPTNNPVRQTDNWLSSEIPKIVQSRAYQSGGAIFITWDEGENSSHGPIGMIILSPLAKGHGYSDAIHYTHSSTLRTMEEIFGVGPLLGDAANATDLSDLFTAFP
jgi:phospholipase C